MIFLQIFRSLEKVNFELLRQSKGLLIAEPQLNFPFITFVGSTRKMNENIQMKSSLIHLAAETQFKSICSKMINILALIHYLHPRIQTSNPFIYGHVQY